MQSPNHEASSISSPMRKRIAATPTNVDMKIFYLTPMPLHSNGLPVTGASSVTSKGDAKQKKGSCVGTKGFRAPEVLFRCPHQGPEIDIWSAGVTLLYLMLGRTPFYGDPEENIKDIAKLRGSEALWELSKLHSQRLWSNYIDPHFPYTIAQLLQFAESIRVWKITRSNPPVHHQQWIPPNNGELKWNVDGSTLGKPGRA